ncbi:MAG: hypothetical protein ACYCX2_04800 [Christensenellales bacterium]
MSSEKVNETGSNFLIRSSPAAMYFTGYSMSGTLNLNRDRLQFFSKNTQLGLLGLLLSKNKMRADIPLETVLSVGQSKRGLMKTIHITVNDGETYDFYVYKTCDEWEKAIKDAILALKS